MMEFVNGVGIIPYMKWKIIQMFETTNQITVGFMVIVTYCATIVARIDKSTCNYLILTFDTFLSAIHWWPFPVRDFVRSMWMFHKK